MVGSTLDYDTPRIIWHGEELVFNSRSKESIKRISDYIGFKVHVLKNGDCVLSTEDYRSDGFNLNYVGDSPKPKQPLGLRNFDHLFEEWKGYRLDLSDWDTSDVTSMRSTFASCHNLESLNISTWNVSNVTDMSMLFHYCTSIKDLDVSRWDVSNVTNMESLFSGCFHLKSLDLAYWSVGNVHNMARMFSQCMRIEKLNISKWDVFEVIDMMSPQKGWL